MIKCKVILTKAECDDLETIVSKGTHSVSKVKNAMALLSCDESEYATKYSNKVIGDIIRVSMKTIERLKKKFVEEGFETIMSPSKSRRMYVKKFDGELEAHLVALCCRETPSGYAKWSLRLLADKKV